MAYEIPVGYTTAVYLIRGSLRIPGHGLVEPETLVVLDEEDTTLALEAKTDAQFLVLSGQPIGEPVVQQGPFVMNTETQILEAMRDYQMGKMGYLVETFESDD